MENPKGIGTFLSGLISLGDLISDLNELVAVDPDAITALIAARVSCNQALADHRSVQVGKLSDGTFEVGFLGVLNGLVGIRPDGYGYITAVFEEDAAFLETGKREPRGFRPGRIVRFEITKREGDQD